MRSDLEVITKTFPKKQNVLRIYPIGDVHVGAENFDEESVQKKIKTIQEDPCGCAVICGDLGDYGLRNSVTNVYKATMSPKEQQEYLYELFKPISHKLAAAVPGNHEDRITKEVGTCPLYDLCVLWGIPEVYRENVAITKYIFGSHHGAQQIVFIGITTHGSTRNKHKKFISGFDGVDFAVSGHTHLQEYSPHGKIRVDRIHGTATHVPYKEIIVDANLKPGGYGLKKEYEIPSPPELQYLELSVYRDKDQSRTDRRVIDYHSITI